MTDVFLSYSRRDIDFARKMIAALEDRELTAWADWEGIIPTAAWLAEIQRAIEGADHFLFLISPDSVASEICALELAHAVEHHKRLVPVRLRPVPPDALPAPLREIQWVDLAEDEPFNAAIVRIADAIRTDPETVRRHTRLLTAAIEWQSRRRERSLLLRGQDLAQAERWLRANPEHPAPTELQRAFVAESRRAAMRLRRLIAGGGAAVTLALLVIGGYYLRERDLARERGWVALSRATAAQALAEQERAFDLALLLAVEAYAISPTLEAEQAVQRILLSKPRLERILATPGVETVGLGFSHDGRRLAAGFGDGSVRVWTDDESSPAMAVAKDQQAPVSAVAFDADLGLAAAGGGQRDAITLRRLPDGESSLLAPPQGHFEVQELRFSSDGQLLASANGNQPDGVTLWNLAGKRISGSPLTGDAGLAAVGFSPDGGAVAAGGWSEQVYLWDVATGRTLQRRKLKGGGGVSGVALNSGWLAAASENIQLFELSRPEDGPVRILESAGGAARSVAFDAAGRWLAGGFDRGIVQLWDMSRPDSPAEALGGPGSYVDELAFSADGRQLATGGYGQPVRVYATDRISRFGRLLGRQSQAVTALGFSPDGRWFAAAGRERVVDLWSSPEGRHERLEGHVSDIRALAFTPDGTTLVSADGRLLPSTQGRSDRLRWDLRGAPVRLASEPPAAVQLQGLWAMFPDLPALRDAPWPVALDSAGETLARPGPYIGGIARIEVVAAADSTVLAQVETGFRHSLLALALSADGQRVAASAADGRYAVWDVDGARRLLEGRSSKEQSCGAVDLDRDGRHLAVACGSELVVHDLAGGARPLAAIQAASGPIEALAFDPAGRRVAASDSASGWILWDVAEARAVGAAFTAPAGIGAMRFSADGARLLTGDREGRVILWDVAVEDWLQRACRVAGRDLTPDEWNRYLPNRVPHATCAAMVSAHRAALR